MKKIILFVTLLFITPINSFMEDFYFPEVDNNVESIKTAFRALLDNVLTIGVIESDSTWNYSAETVSARYREHIDEFLIDMTYKNIRLYVESIDKAIKQLDYNSMTKREINNFTNFLNNADEYYVRFSNPKIQELWKDITKFQTWKDYFNGADSILPIFIFDQETCKVLYEMIEQDVPQKLTSEYTKKLNELLKDWGRLNE